MSPLMHLRCHLVIILAAFNRAESDNEYYTARWSRCTLRSRDFSDMVYTDSFYFNKYLFVQFNSTAGRFVGFNEYGVSVAERWNNSPFLQSEKSTVETECKFHFEVKESAVRDKAVKPQVKLSLVKQAGGRHPAVLMCSAYEYYPPHILMSWVRDGEVMTSEVTSTMELADGDWYYQIHSELEYTPKPGEKISCVVEHASSAQPIMTDWDPSIPKSERNKIIIGALGLVLGIIIAVAGLIYYKMKSAGGALLY